MRGVFAILLTMVLGIDGLWALTTSDCADQSLCVTVQIHDYARVQSEVLAQACDIVSRVYSKIGVRTEWIGVLRPKERRHAGRGRDDRYSQLGQLTIIILTPQMAIRGRIADDILGFAAVPEEGMGRIAYVMHDRVRQVAVETTANYVDLLAFVMAHEIGHLLLPRGAQSETGMMRKSLDRGYLRTFDVQALEFSALEARQIRDMLERHSR